MKPKVNRGSNEYEPQGFDLCQTPPYALDPLWPHLDGIQTIWEPACGEGYLADTLSTTGFKVLRTDLLTGQNFFEYQPEEGWDCLITNPPFSLKYRWLERCYDLGKPFVLLLPVETLGAKQAQDLFREFGIEVIFMDQRVNFKMPNKGWKKSAAQFPTAWFTWQMKLGKSMIFAHIKRKNVEPILELW